MPRSASPRPPWALAIWSLAAACSGPPADNLLLVSFDTTRADRLSAYGYPHPTSPAIDALAERGTLFENAYSHAPSTLPAHASLLTGLLPPGHGARANGRFQLSERHSTLAELLSEEGFDTAGFIGALPIDRRFGMAQGFDLYDGDFASQEAGEARGAWLGHAFGAFERGAEEVTGGALAWLRQRPAGKRWFLFVHFFDPHKPYAAPAPFAERFEHPYDAEIAFADHHLGRLLEAVRGVPGKTLVVFTADHGEGLGEHGEEAHNRYLYDSTIRVPLIFALDGVVTGGATVRSPVSHVDVLPTVLELLGLDGARSAELPGRSLAPVLVEGAEPEPRAVYSETLEWKLGIAGGVEVRALVDGRFKLVRSDVERDGGGFLVLELYDLEADPAERVNLARRDAETRDRLARRLTAWSHRLEAEAFEPEGYDLDEATLEGLKSLGYLE